MTKKTSVTVVFQSLFGDGSAEDILNSWWAGTTGGVEDGATPCGQQQAHCMSFSNSENSLVLYNRTIRKGCSGQSRSIRGCQTLQLAMFTIKKKDHIYVCSVRLLHGVCTEFWCVCVSNGRAGKVAWVTCYYVYTGHDMGHLQCAMHTWCGVCACMCCLGLSAKSNVCDVRYSVLFSLCLECVMTVGHVWYFVYVYVCVCLCLCVWVHVCARVYMSVRVHVWYCVWCAVWCTIYLYFLYIVVVLCVMWGMGCAVYSDVFLLPWVPKTISTQRGKEHVGHCFRGPSPQPLGVLLALIS